MKWTPILILVGLVACKPAKKEPATVDKISQTFDLQGHRGCRGLLPENTIPAFMKALTIGVNTLEMDVVISADRQVVLSHEPFFNHEITTKPNGALVLEGEEKSLNLYRMDYAEIRRFDVGLRPHPRFLKQEKIPAYKPRLAEVFDSVKHWCNQNKQPLPFFNIETKSRPSTDTIYHPAPAEFVDLLVATIQEAGVAEKCIIQSFDIRTLQYLHQQHPEIATALLVEATEGRGLKALIDELGFIPTIFSPDFLLVSAELVKECHQMGMKIVPWTVNDAEEMNRLKEMGIDGLITDYPNLYIP